jgi:hypothetical protein
MTRQTGSPAPAIKSTNWLVYASAWERAAEVRGWSPALRRKVVDPPAGAGLGHDFRRMRVHTHDAAAQAAQGIRARIGAPRLVQRYTAAATCSTSKERTDQIAKAHATATKVLPPTIDALKQKQLDATVALELKKKFGKGAEARIGTISANLDKIRGALAGNYQYHCADSCVKPHQAARAWTDPSGDKDITLCMNKVGGFDARAMAWIMIHENVHRGLDVWPKPHPWEPKDYMDCVANAPPTQDTPLLLTSPDSYACLASRLGYKV